MVFFFEVGKLILEVLFWSVFVYGLYRVFKAILFRGR